MKTILVTGASGFIGSFLVEEALEKGLDVWAGVRATSSKAYLSDPRIHFASLSLSDPKKLQAQLRALRQEMGGKGWDYVVHAAGVTKCLHPQEFYEVNTAGTRHLIEALRATDMWPEKMVFLSSLSVFGAIREEPVRRPTADNPWVYAPILDTDTPKPNTHYGKSKLLAEEYLRAQQDLNLTILRPTGVYGPREKDYFLMAKSIRQHIDFSVGYKPQEITFVYVMDVVQAVLKCLDAPATSGKAYFLSDGEVYHSRRFSDLLQQELGDPWVVHLKAPLWLLRTVCSLSGRISRLTRRMNALNDDKYHILKQRNWQCDIAPAQRDFGYAPEWSLEKGVKTSVQWYKEAGWL